MSVSVSLADAVVTDTNNADLTPAFTPVRKIRPKSTHEELAALKVTVVPKTYQREVLTRGRDRELPQVDIGIQQQCDPDDEPLADQLIGLGESLAKYWIGRKPTAQTNYTCIAATFEPIYRPDRLDQEAVFEGVVTLTFQTVSARQ